MDATSSLSKGCFAFTPKSSKAKKKKRGHGPDEFEAYCAIPQVSKYTSIINQIEEQLKEINSNASDEVLQELVHFVSTCPNSDFAIPTAVLLTGVNLPDHGVLFQALADRLHEGTTQHVATLLSSECTSVKNTIEQFTSQFLKQSTTPLDVQMDVDDSDSEEEEEGLFDEVKRSQCTMPNLLAWYNERKTETCSPKKQTKSSSSEKLVIIVPDFESFSTKVLQDVILILSGYLDRLPLVLVFGVATSVKALQSSLPHRITSRMDVRMFQSKQSVHFLNKTVNEVLLSWKKSRTYPFLLGPKMFKLLTDVFIFYDFSVHGFVQGVKYCLMEHFYNNPLSRLCSTGEQLGEVLDQLEKKDFERVGSNRQFQAYVEKLPAQRMEKLFSNNRKYFKEVILELLNNLHQQKDELLLAVWLLHTLVHDLPESPLGKQVREVYIEALSGPIAEHPKFQRSFELLNLMSKQELVHKLTTILSILNETECMQEEKIKLTELQKSLKNAGETLKSPSASPSKKRTLEKQITGNIGSSRKQYYQQFLTKNVKEENEFEKSRSNLLSYLKSLFQKYLISPTTLPLHEVVFIDNISAKRHIVGAPRAALHTALNNPHHYLQCDCCKISNNGEILPTMPDICIAYKLHLESGALINMYDWLQSFVTIVSPGDENRDERKVDPAIQARFTRAVSELQFLGFIKASKKRTDHVARLTWGATC